MKQFRTVWDTNSDLIRREYEEPIAKVYEREEEEYYNEKEDEHESNR